MSLPTFIASVVMQLNVRLQHRRVPFLLLRRLRFETTIPTSTAANTKGKGEEQQKQ